MGMRFIGIGMECMPDGVRRQDMALSHCLNSTVEESSWYILKKAAKKVIGLQLSMDFDKTPKDEKGQPVFFEEKRMQ